MKHDEWWREAVLYQIYPRSFADSDGDGVGDLPGVIDRLGYLAELGVDAVWLSPFYPSPLADFGYDVSDFQAVDPSYGTLEDFDELLRRAHEHGIRVVVDLIMNHTSVEHPWFAESRSSRTSPKRDWYIWADSRPDGGPPNNWLSAFEKCGPAWTFDEPTGQCYLHSFTPGQPDLNWRNPEVRAAMREVWRFWLDRGVDGFRVDVAHRLMKDAELRDNIAELAHARRHVSHPLGRQRHLDLPETFDVLRDLRRTLDSYEGTFALGEVPISDDRRLAEYFGGDGMHTAFHIAFWEQPWRAAAFRETVDRLAAYARPGALPTYALATHDISRTVTRYGGGGRPRVAAAMMTTLRGIPCVYYGEEIGMADAPPPLDGLLDVDGRDGTRVPMQWDETGAGFSRAAPWLPFASDQHDVNVVKQLDDPDSLLSLYRRLIAFRRDSPALRRGEYRSLDCGGDVFAYLRSVPGERLLVALNFAPHRTEVALPELPPHGRLELSTGTGEAGSPVDPRSLSLAPDEGVIVRIGGTP
ncbi:alpha-amylase family glycosyl hydrolase [Sphaerisporangium sp. TRM90804]|uniref:alpha-amylase family glycosyl hydrolase n=1 Tax=Sphaerisporangium sp. TRM90804 TaxID=3031113 RepID=UPI00244A3260|nr:alpha-amylase family glycosyl hydrolase [Sphaerisporangium sp. TRM90804]MDH2426549.1 alpha-amylase family glycosyl hydrolase [Sphaerisporangium sp. TRM90804]